MAVRNGRSRHMQQQLGPGLSTAEDLCKPALHESIHVAAPASRSCCSRDFIYNRFFFFILLLNPI